MNKCSGLMFVGEEKIRTKKIKTHPRAGIQGGRRAKELILKGKQAEMANKINEKR